jgi:predicted enzyme related to lactoylglutathione lyase
MNTRTDLRGGIPVLPVEDIDVGVDYYQRFLGFGLIARSDEPAMAVLGRGGSAVLLRTAGPTDPARHPGGREAGAIDAVLSSDDLDTTFADLSVRGVALRSPVVAHQVLGRMFVINDRFGNVLCFSEAPDRVGAALRRKLRYAAVRLHAARFARAAAADLRPHYEAFQRFYERLDNKQDIFYMFFTGGLVHWAAKAASYVPPEVNLVLLGSHLSAEERQWVTTNLRRPLHHIDVHTNDWAVWDFLFDANRHNFGWLDIDCLALNGDIFAEVAKVPADAAVNCLWSYDSGFGFRIANTYLVFINAEAIRTLRERGIPVSARPHDWRGGDRSAQAGKRCFYRIPSARERRVMLDVVPSDGYGRPRPPGSGAFFDTLSVYQILARASGYRTNQVRNLDNPMLGPVEEGKPRSLDPQGMSDELIHVGGISYYHAHFRDPSVRVRYLAADFVTLAAWAPRLPAPYGEQLESVAEELRSFGADPGGAADALRDYLCGTGGLSPAAAGRAIGA